MTTMTFHRLHQMIDDEARRAVVELLDAMQDHLRFELGTDLHVASDDVTVLVRCVRTDPQRYYYAGVLLAGAPAGREVADIPWSLRSSTGHEIGRSVTGTGGHFGFSVSKRLAEHSNSVILCFGQNATLAARQAAMLAARSIVLDISRALAEFGRVNAGWEEDLQPVVAPALGRLDEEIEDVWRCAPVVTLDLAAGTADDGPRPSRQGDWAADSGDWSVEEGRETWIAIRDDRIRVRAPAELVPYGVVRILAKDNDALVGTCLLPLIKFQTERSNLWPIWHIVRNRDPKSVTWYAQAATEETLPWFPADEVAALLDYPDVRESEELRDRVEQLLALVRQREEETGDG